MFFKDNCFPHHVLLHKMFLEFRATNTFFIILQKFDVRSEFLNCDNFKSLLPKFRASAVLLVRTCTYLTFIFIISLLKSRCLCVNLLAAYSLSFSCRSTSFFFLILTEYSFSHHQSMYPNPQECFGST